MTAYLRLKTKRPENPPPPARLTPWQQRILETVIEAARRTPGALRMLARGDLIFTAQCHAGGRFGEHTRWRIEDTFRNLIATGEC